MKKNSLVDSLDLYTQAVEHTYYKGDYVAKLDHILIRETSKYLVKSSHIDDAIETSDHYPVKCNFTYTIEPCESGIESAHDLFHKF